ncbi:PaaI family thioesterase [Lactobacillus alvi]|uniref:PaaI family thioesterase n=1 Tax=Limosilactobacillus alvi TaxID=990412 RepID=A0ABS2EP94_9LACO|nr:PaaI family thioesterase [Limosilactobacillus alvi]MBM6754235.1 PaaI family thioesterase [Limosilactobacillus alvi]
MNLLENLGIEIQKLSKTNTIVSLPVTKKILQPLGFVHGGINAVLAETAASLGANENLASNQIAVGVDITTHHLGAVTNGTLIATAIPIHIGKHLQTWEVKIRNNHQITSISTVTLSAINKS